MNIHGLVTLSKLTDTNTGKPVSFEKAVKYGWLKSCEPAKVSRDWKVPNGELVLGENLFLDSGRQCLAYLLGGRSPLSTYSCQSFGVGIGTLAPKVTDTGLQSGVIISGAAHTKTIDSADWSSPFVIKYTFTLGAAEANGYLVTEMGLFTSTSTIIARKVFAAGLNKTSDVTPSFSWQVRC